MTDLEKNLKDEQAQEISIEKQEQVINEFSKFSGATQAQLKASKAYGDLATSALNSFFGELPTGKYLVQNLVDGPTNTLMNNFINTIFSELEYIPTGQGAEYILELGNVVNTLDETKFVPETRFDIANKTNVDKIDLPTTVKQVELSLAPWKYFQYFLSGKVEEVGAQVEFKSKDTIRQLQNYQAVQLLKTIFQNVYAKASSTAGSPTNHLEGDNTLCLVDALSELKTFVFGMLSPNKIFHYSSEFTGYNNAEESDLIYISDAETKNNIDKVATTFLTKEQLTTFSSLNNWVVVPNSIYNPGVEDVVDSQVGRIEQVKLFETSAGEYIRGCVLVVQKSSLKRLFNIDSQYAEYYPKNMTTQTFLMSRFTQNILKWGQVAVYHNEALISKFYLPTKEATAVLRAKK